MDPLCHTLVGTALGCTGLERRARFGRTTLIVGANFPDIDWLASRWGLLDSLAIRRGSTHGLLALVLLPLLLAVVMKLLSRFRPRSIDSHDAPFGQLLLLATVAVATHPVLDYLNTYGIRWLMPMVDRWWYGDILFIVDPWMWMILLAGIVLTRMINAERLSILARPAVVALLLIVVYIGLNAAGGMIARRVALNALSQEIPLRLMAAPVFMNPFRRKLVLDYGIEYRFGSVALLPNPTFEFDALRVSKRNHPAFERAARTRAGEIFLHWARFPFAEVVETPDSTIVYIMDARYMRERDEGFGMVRIELPLLATTVGD